MRAIIICALAAMAGCATQPVGLNESKLGALIPNQYVEPFEGAGKLIIVRDAGFLGGGCSDTVYVDGSPIARLFTRQNVVAYLTPGEHIAGAKGCGGENAEIAIMIAAGATKVYRTGFSQGGITIQPSAFQ